MNFEQLKLQMHLRGLYERLGPEQAEELISRAVEREMDRYDRLLQQQAADRAEKSGVTPTA